VDFGVVGHISKHKTSEEVTILDVGCSTGVAMHGCISELKRSRIKSKSVLVDMCETVCNKATNLFLGADNVTVKNKNIMNLVGYDNQMDFVICMNVATKIKDELKSDIIDKCAKILKSDGRLIINKSIIKNISNQGLGDLDTEYLGSCWMLLVGNKSISAVSMSKQDAFNLAKKYNPNH